MKNEWRKHARARDQLYHLLVAFRALDQGITKARRTPELRQCLDLVQHIIQSSCDAFARGHILEVLVNEYVPTTLPDIDDLIAAANQEMAEGDDDRYAF